MADRVTERKKLGLWARLKRVALTDVGAMVRGFKAADIEAMERLLLESDFGLPATMDLVEMLEDGVRRGRLKSEDDLKAALVAKLTELLTGPGDPGAIARAESGPSIILVVGVNGAGKTTSVAKLARRLSQQGERVLLGAADRSIRLSERLWETVRNIERRVTTFDTTLTVGFLQRCNG